MKNESKGSMKHRNPVVPFFGEAVGEDYKDDQYLNVLCDLLKGNAPELLSRFKYIVIESSRRSEKRKQELVELEKDKFELIGKIQDQEDELDYRLTQLPKEPTDNRWQIVLTAGLSIFMVVGVANLFDIPREEIFRLENLHVLVISLIAAACINIGERKAIESHTKYVFDVERHASKKKGGETSGEAVGRSPFRTKWLKLNPATYVAAAVLVCETAFVSLGFLSGETPMMTAQPVDPIVAALENVSIIAASALAGLVNIALAWGDALQKVSWERENLDKKKEIVDSYFSSDLHFASQRQLDDLEKQIAKKEKEAELARKLSVEEHIRFSQDLAEYLISKPFGVDTSAYGNGSGSPFGA